MDGNVIPFPAKPGPNGSPRPRVVPYPAKARVIQEHEGHSLDPWDQIVRLVPLVRDLIDLILSLGSLVDEQGTRSAEGWLESYWGLVGGLIRARRAIDIAALKREYGRNAPPIPRYDDKLDDEIAVAAEDLEWLIPALEEIAAEIDQAERHLNEGERGDAAEIIGGLIGLTDREDVSLSFGELFRCWQSYKLDEEGNPIDEEGDVYAHISEFEDEDEG
jgi:hypothetical protein